MLPTRWIWAAGLVFAVATWRTAESCSCMGQHPQTHYCRSDFVIVATARRLLKSNVHYENHFKLKIRKEFKMSDKAKVALKAGRMITANDDGLCGVSLQLNQTYLITGQVISLQAHVNLCNYVKLWRTVTPRQRKGFRMLYKQGCPCRIEPCSPYGCDKKHQKHVCKLEDPFNQDNCHSSNGICLINKDGHCSWAKAINLSKCLREYQKNKQQSPLLTY